MTTRRRIILIEGGREIEPEQFEPEATCSAPLPELAQPFTEREQKILLERRYNRLRFGLAVITTMRTELLDVASRAIVSQAYDVADSLLSLVQARDVGAGKVVPTYLRELLIESGEAGMWSQRCEECGCTDEVACEPDAQNPYGCSWIEPGLCSHCANRLLDRKD